ncbi:cell division protein ZapA [Solemya pervernicosa gill symbiont]|uniref:Cell division protein ZapA n=2 Tax=Gammaproteobacteria incertae sedis TaxID=118884 RepID=A0A1T2L342_9GAMM|nr:cell division protein ZapA [Candidatus Reidiella endopervernicosa]OOZ39494.1 cell division protein ZapA [Solemya pervernicosa gill symbiont]QKQ25882.1 cell division protein ZapA [Candidatus Reidiella endopervernicosa]
MSEKSSPVTVKILDKEYRVSCADNEREELLASSRYLNEQMLEIRRGGKVIGADRIAVMAALNIAHELLSCQKQLEGVDKTLHSRIKQIQDKIEVALNHNKQMEL